MVLEHWADPTMGYGVLLLSVHGMYNRHVEQLVYLKCHFAW